MPIPPARAPHRRRCGRARPRNPASKAAATRYICSSPRAGPMICRPTGRPVSDAIPLGTLIAGMPASEPGMVARSLRYMAIGSSTFSPSLERRHRRGRRDQHIGLCVGVLEVLPDQRPHLERGSVIGVVVAGAQRVGAKDDAALDLRAETRAAGSGHHVLRRDQRSTGRDVADPQAVAHGVEPGQVGRALARQDQVVGRQRVFEVRAGDLDDLGTRCPSARPPQPRRIR